ncbi:hypothetical protein ABIA35_005981 [Catenulispora sp. MAP12-49]|uniref:hypothetical protein n=1 Tax=unclassified Catenulispora TaxID=414885 RepID=UPI0035144498
MSDEMAVQVADALEDVRRVLQDPAPAVTDQHLVSRVLLKRFAAHGGLDARNVVPFDLARPEAKSVLGFGDGNSAHR